MYRVFFNFAKSEISFFLTKCDKKKKVQRAVFEIEVLKAKIKGYLAGHNVAMVAYPVMKMIMC